MTTSGWIAAVALSGCGDNLEPGRAPGHRHDRGCGPHARRARSLHHEHARRVHVLSHAAQPRRHAQHESAVRGMDVRGSGSVPRHRSGRGCGLPQRAQPDELPDGSHERDGRRDRGGDEERRAHQREAVGARDAVLGVSQHDRRGSRCRGRVPAHGAGRGQHGAAERAAMARDQRQRHDEPVVQRRHVHRDADRSERHPDARRCAGHGERDARALSRRHGRAVHRLPHADAADGWRAVSAAVSHAGRNESAANMQMPPIATDLPDTDRIELVRLWIDSL